MQRQKQAGGARHEKRKTPRNRPSFIGPPYPFWRHRFSSLRFPGGALPEKIPAHYNAFGEVTRWGSKYELIILHAINIGLFALLAAVERKPEIWNLPVLPTPQSIAPLHSAVKSMLCWLRLETTLAFGYLAWMPASAVISGKIPFMLALRC